jgi:hypothetical protein
LALPPAADVRVLLLAELNTIPDEPMMTGFLLQWIDLTDYYRRRALSCGTKDSDKAGSATRSSSGRWSTGEVQLERIPPPAIHPGQLLGSSWLGVRVTLVRP